MSEARQPVSWSDSQSVNGPASRPLIHIASERISRPASLVVQYALSGFTVCFARPQSALRSSSMLCELLVCFERLLRLGPHSALSITQRDLLFRFCRGEGAPFDEVTEIILSISFPSRILVRPKILWGPLSCCVKVLLCRG